MNHIVRWCLAGLVACTSTAPLTPPPGTGDSASSTGSTGTGITDACAWSDAAPEAFSGAVGSMEACVGGLATEEEETGVPGPLQITVTDRGTGDRPEDCTSFVVAGPALDTDWAWVRGTSSKDGRARVIGWRFAEPTAVPEVSDVLTVTLDIQEKAYVGTQELELGVVGDDGLVAWVQRGWHLDMLRRSPLGLTAAAEVGAGRDDCGHWTYRDAMVDGVSVPYGQTATVGADRVVHGGLAAVEGTLDMYACKQCEWWTYPESAMGAFRPAP